MNLLAHLKYTFRQINKNPGFFGIALAALALGIGANTAIFSAVEAMLLRPLPFMTSLTINPFRKVPSKDRISARNIASGGHLRISIVTKYASIRNQSPGLRMTGIESWTHAAVRLLRKLAPVHYIDEALMERAMGIGLQKFNPV